MNREKKLIKNTFIVAIGKICTQFIGFFLLPLYTTILSAKEYGIVDIVNTIISLAIPIIFLQIEQAIFRYLIDSRNNKQEQQEIISSTFIIMIIIGIITTTIYFVISLFISNEYKYYLIILLLVTAFANYCLQVSRGLDDTMSYSQGSLIAGIGVIIFNVIFIVTLGLGAKGMILSSILSNALCMMFIIIKKDLVSYINFKYYNKDKLLTLLKYSIPLIPNQLSWWIINASDRTLITYFIDIASNGVYSIANKFSTIIISIFNIFNITWAESASETINDNDRDIYFSKIFTTALKFCGALCLGTIAIMPFVFKILIPNENYAAAYNQIPIIMLSVFFNIIVSLTGSVYVALKKSNEIAKTSILAATINLIINISLIKYIGLYAASISTLISYMLLSLYRIKDIRKYIKITFDKNHIVSIIILTIVTMVFYYLKNNIICLLVLSIVIVHSLIHNYEIFIEIIKFLRKKINK